ncbi:MAG: ATP F0F1 synthase subunit B [Rubricella sp.]
MSFLYNTDIVVAIGFVVFIGVLLYFKVPGLILGLLDKRAERISTEIDEARQLREEAQALLASYERKQKEVEEQTADIVTRARADAEAAKEQAMVDLEESIERRLRTAKEQIASAEADALRQVKNRAVTVAVAAAAEVLSSRMDEAKANALLEKSIEDVSAKLH